MQCLFHRHWSQYERRSRRWHNNFQAEEGRKLSIRLQVVRIISLIAWVDVYQASRTSHCNGWRLNRHVIVSDQSSFPLVFMSRQIPTMQSLCPYILSFSPNSLYVHYLFHTLGFESPASEFCGNHNNHQSSSSYCHRHTFMFRSCSNLCQTFSCPWLDNNGYVRDLINVKLFNYGLSILYAITDGSGDSQNNYGMT